MVDISGLGQISQHNIQHNKADSKLTNERIADVIEQMVDITEEMAGKESMGRTKVFSSGANYIEAAHVPKTKANEQQMIDEALAAIAALIGDDDEIRKKEKNKKKKLDQKMAELAKLEGHIDMDELDPEEQGVVNEFFENIRKLKKLKKKYKELEEKEQRFSKVLKFNQEKNKRDQAGG